MHTFNLFLFAGFPNCILGFFFSPSLFDEWQMLCYAFVNEVKENIKPKTQLLLHLVECMHDFGPSFAFCGERYCCFQISHVYRYAVILGLNHSTRESEDIISLVIN